MKRIQINPVFIVALLAAIVKMVQGQEENPPAPPSNSPCYGSGSIALAVILTFFGTVIVLAVLFFWWKRRQGAAKENHLILESDPERGTKADFAFDNPGFKDTTLVTTTEKSSKIDNSGKSKWSHWSPLSALKLKSEKKRALDDSALQNHQVKVVALKSQDFTGLGFNVCGNMKEGIYIKDILHRGPAFESGKLNPGDRINSVTISFEHMVYEDALTILSYASPYEVIIEAKSGRVISFSQGQGQFPVHPVYRSSSMTDLFFGEKSTKRKLFGDDYSSGSNYSSLQKSRSNVTTLERKESKSPLPMQPKSKKADKSPAKMTPETLKTHLEKKITEESLSVRDKIHKIDSEVQNTENRGQKFGVKVFPAENLEKSPKIMEQNQNNVNIEKNMDDIVVRRMDEVDMNITQPPQAKKREKKSPELALNRNGSGIRRDEDGIPLEIPDHMLDAAVVARKNRKTSTESGLSNGDIKKAKGKAPSPPSEVKLNFGLHVGKTRAFEDLSSFGTGDSSPNSSNIRYGSDSEEETDNNMSSVNTIELNSSDITIHQTEEEERKARKTASTGDLSKMKKGPKSNTGTLERAQSLDITDNTSGPILTNHRIYDARENLLIDKEPRLSLILDGLTTFQRNKLKKSNEWGNLEDAILKFSRDDEEWEQRRKSEPQFNAVMDRVIQIKRESEELEIIPDEIVRQYQQSSNEKLNPPKAINKIWPDEFEASDVQFKNSGWKRIEPQEELSKTSLEMVDTSYMKRQQVPPVPERTFNNMKLKVTETVVEPAKIIEDVAKFNFEEKHEKENDEKIPQPRERVSKIELNTDNSNKVQSLDNSKSSTPINLSNVPTSNITVEIECVKPVPPKRERTPDKETVIDLTDKVKGQPITSFEKNNLIRTCSDMAKDRNPDGKMIKDEWETDLISTSPPASMNLVDEIMESYNKNYGSPTVTIKTDKQVTPSSPLLTSTNIPDETKTVGNLKSATTNFIFTEKSVYDYDTNIPDDVKVSRSYESLEMKKPEVLSNIEIENKNPIEDRLVSHVTVTENGGSNLHSLELSINNEPSELYTTALDNTLTTGGVSNDVTVIVSKPDKIIVKKIETSAAEPLVEITENSFSKVTKGVDEIPVNISDSKHIKVSDGDHDNFKVEITESKYSTFEVDKPHLKILNKEFHIQEPLVDEAPRTVIDNSVYKSIDDESPAISLTEIKPLEESSKLETSDSASEDKKTYITEIQVMTPNSSPLPSNSTITNVSNVSEVQVSSQNTDEHIENAFENYVKNFESKLHNFESNIQNFENNLEEFMRDEPKSIVLEEKNDVEKQVSKIQEIAEEQLKTLPEMRFTTSSYTEAGRKTPEKRHSFELLRSNFEKASSERSPPRRDSNTTPTKSRIPISTTMKTPPMSPERRDSRNLENENEKAILELMASSTIHSTPFTSKIKPPSAGSKNVSVTSIRNNSKIPSGLPTLASRPPIPPRKSEDNGVQVSTNGGMDSNFKQWVFNPNSNVTNVTVGKDK